MEFKWIFVLALYIAGAVIALGWYVARTPRNDQNAVDLILAMVGYPLILLFKFGQFLAVAK